uniref:Uncharacterized protein n=1 Tax=Aquila chrysaetos chrysaetos TaxID=223781 RepID=A0A663DWP5_AQUCH
MSKNALADALKIIVIQKKWKRMVQFFTLRMSDHKAGKIVLYFMPELCQYVSSYWECLEDQESWHQMESRMANTEYC